MEAMIQDYSKYNDEDSLVWKTLFERQVKNLQGKAHPEYLDSLEKLKEVLNPNRIPKFEELSAALKAENGWEIVVVPGLIPVDDFFRLLSERKFCSSTWLRKMSQLDYLEEPDMFHDIFGHTPLLLNKEYADFVQQFGKLGVKYGHNKVVEKQLQSLYWFTIEFGLIKHQEKNSIYGAGILSSSGESNHIFNDEINVSPYNVDKILNNDFITSEIQTQYYEIESLEQLYLSLGKLEESLKEEVLA